MTEPEAGNITTENVPMRLSETPGEVRGLAPLMGQHTYEIARDLLGLKDDEIRQLEAELVLYSGRSVPLAGIPLTPRYKNHRKLYWP